MNIMANIASGAAPADLTYARGLLNSGGGEGVRAMYAYLAQGTFPELPSFQVDTVTPATTLEM